jgi:hypothetical protein
MVIVLLPTFAFTRLRPSVPAENPVMLAASLAEKGWMMYEELLPRKGMIVLIGRELGRGRIGDRQALAVIVGVLDVCPVLVYGRKPVSVALRWIVQCDHIGSASPLISRKPSGRRGGQT